MDEEKETTDTLYYYYDGSAIAIDSVTSKHLYEPVKVYNFEVEDVHTYFVGHDDILVHNVCPDSNQRAVQQIAKDYRHGISEQDAFILWAWAVEYKVPGHGPGYDIYKYGYHLKIYNVHVNIR